ncbi:MAG: hypothetical protein KAJ54_02470 [Candidatus Aenigmarchaeota archaeon]|nr:hypothetical protein [Candidatus Aenigmarchaeota archaeon]
MKPLTSKQIGILLLISLALLYTQIPLEIAKPTGALILLITAVYMLLK